MQASLKALRLPFDGRRDEHPPRGERSRLKRARLDDRSTLERPRIVRGQVLLRRWMPIGSATCNCQQSRTHLVTSAAFPLDYRALRASRCDLPGRSAVPSLWPKRGVMNWGERARAASTGSLVSPERVPQSGLAPIDGRRTSSAAIDAAAGARSSSLCRHRLDMASDNDSIRPSIESGADGLLPTCQPGQGGSLYEEDAAENMATIRDPSGLCPLASSSHNWRRLGCIRESNRPHRGWTNPDEQGVGLVASASVRRALVRRNKGRARDLIRP